jgi:hypothetical protein
MMRFRSISDVLHARTRKGLAGVVVLTAPA